MQDQDLKILLSDKTITNASLYRFMVQLNMTQLPTTSNILFFLSLPERQALLAKLIERPEFFQNISWEALLQTPAVYQEISCVTHAPISKRSACLYLVEAEGGEQSLQYLDFNSLIKILTSAERRGECPKTRGDIQWFVRISELSPEEQSYVIDSASGELKEDLHTDMRSRSFFGFQIDPPEEQSVQLPSIKKHVITPETLSLYVLEELEGDDQSSAFHNLFSESGHEILHTILSRNLQLFQDIPDEITKKLKDIGLARKMFENVTYPVSELLLKQKKIIRLIDIEDLRKKDSEGYSVLERVSGHNYLDSILYSIFEERQDLAQSITIEDLRRTHPSGEPSLLHHLSCPFAYAFILYMILKQHPQLAREITIEDLRLKDDQGFSALDYLSGSQANPALWMIFQNHSELAGKITIEDLRIKEWGSEKLGLLNDGRQNSYSLQIIFEKRPELAREITIEDLRVKTMNGSVLRCLSGTILRIIFENHPELAKAITIEDLREEGCFFRLSIRSPGVLRLIFENNERLVKAITIEDLREKDEKGFSVLHYLSETPESAWILLEIFENNLNLAADITGDELNSKNSQNRSFFDCMKNICEEGSLVIHIFNHTLAKQAKKRPHSPNMFKEEGEPEAKRQNRSPSPPAGSL